jgi:CRP/FNR family transcriptional regulator, cyclic AMP receptor protein
MTTPAEKFGDASVVSVLDEDADLAAVVPGQDLDSARRRAIARVQRVDPGRWSFEPLREPGAFGLLVLEGLAGARVAIGHEAHIDIVGEGDLVRPWAQLGAEASVASSVDWRVFERTTLAVLDERFAHAVSPWPQIAAVLMHRLVLRTRRLSFQLALAGISRTDERLLMALWHFADRWGRVTQDGVVLRLALTQAQLGEVIRAARPSVSTAANDLRRAGRLSFDRHSCVWTLHDRPVGYEPVSRASSSSRSRARASP